MTLNQVLQRLQILATAHKQIKQYRYANVVDFLNQKTALYPCCLVQDLPGSIDAVGKTITLNFRLFFLDLVNVSASTKQNEQDVMSDMMSVAQDIIAQIDYSGYADWKIGSSSPTQFLAEQFNDMVAGVSADINIQTPWDKNVCAVPANSFTFPLTDSSMKPVYDLIYHCNGTEGSTISHGALTGKKILMFIRETFTQFEVNAFDENQSSEFLWEYSDRPLININLGTPANAGERFLILYRNY